MFCSDRVGLFGQWGLVEQFKEVGVVNGTFGDFPLAFRIILMLMCFWWTAAVTARNGDIGRETLYAVYGFSVLMTFMNIYIVNPFSTLNGSADFSMALFDDTSVTETIYNVLDGVPFTYTTSGLYGHYALFLWIPLKILGSGNIHYKIIGLLAVCGCLAQIAVIYAIHVFGGKRWIRAVLALAAVVRTTYTYPAVSPIRTLFPLLLCWYMAYLYRHKKKAWGGVKNRWFWIGFALCSAAVLWNTETGLGCLIGYAAYIFVEQWQNHAWLERKMIYVYASVAGALLGSVLLAVVILNLYNFSCGFTHPAFRAFFYPYVNSAFATEGIRCNLPLGNHAWQYLMALLLGSLCWALGHTRLCGRKTAYMNEASVIAGMAAAGLIVFAYYVNVAHWGCMKIVHQIAVILSAVIITKLWPVLVKWKEHRRMEHQISKSIVILALAVYSVLALQTLNDPVRLAAKNRAGAYSLNAAAADAEALSMEIPENTYGVGQGIHIIYHMLGWDNHAKYRDTTSINLNASGKEDAFDDLKAEILRHDSFLIGDAYECDKNLAAAVLAEDDRYVLDNQVSVCNMNYSYYVRKKRDRR